MNAGHQRGGRNRTSRKHLNFRTQQRRLVWQVQHMADGSKPLILDTDGIRKQILFQLQALFDMAAQAAIDTSSRDWKQKEAWSKTATYIAQTINHLSSTYDLRNIKEATDDLAKLLNEINTEAVNTPLQEQIVEAEKELQELRARAAAQCTTEPQTAEQEAVGAEKTPLGESLA